MVNIHLEYGLNEKSGLPETDLNKRVENNQDYWKLTGEYVVFCKSIDNENSTSTGFPPSIDILNCQANYWRQHQLDSGCE